MEENKSHRVHALIKEAVVPDGKPSAETVTVEGLVRKFIFDKQALEGTKDRVLALMDEILQPEFYKDRQQPDHRSGGWSFLQLAADKQGHHWAEHPTMEAFCCLAMGLGLAAYLFPREFWGALPGGVPYIVFSKDGGLRDTVFAQGGLSSGIKAQEEVDDEV